jgi:hypothetical protein
MFEEIRARETIAALCNGGLLLSLDQYLPDLELLYTIPVEFIPAGTLP